MASAPRIHFKDLQRMEESGSNPLSGSNGRSQMVYGRSQSIARKHIMHGYHELRRIHRILLQVLYHHTIPDWKVTII